MRDFPLVAAAALAACTTAPPAEPPSGGPRAAGTQEIRLERLGGAFEHVYRFSTGLDQPLNDVVRSQSEWEALWSRITARHGNPGPPPVLDFDRNMLLVAAMGMRPSGGYAIGIEKVTDGGAELVAHVVRTSPGSRCGTTAALTQPVDIVAVPASPKPVRWEARDEVSDCS